MTNDDIDDSARRPSDAEIAERAAALKTARRLLIEQFEAFVSDETWVMQNLQARNNELQNDARQSRRRAAPSNSDTDAHIRERAAELDAVRRRLIREPQETEFGPSIEMSRFEDFADDASWLVLALLTRNAELQDDARRHRPTPAPKQTPTPSLAENLDMSPGEMVMYGLAEQPPNAYSAAEIAMMDAHTEADDTPVWDAVGWFNTDPAARPTLSTFHTRTLRWNLIQAGIDPSAAEDAARDAFDREEAR